MVETFAGDYKFDIMETIRRLKELTDEKGKPMLVPKQLDTFRTKFGPIWNAYQQNTKYEDLFCYLAERALLGFSYSNTLFNLYSRSTKGLTPIVEVLDDMKGEKVSFVAFVDEVKKGTGRQSKKPYVRFELSDESGKIRAMLNGQNKIDSNEQMNGRALSEGDIVVCHGTKAEDRGEMIFADEMILQECAISIKKTKVEQV